MIPYIQHEAELSRMERKARRLWITVMVLLFALLASNAVHLAIVLK